MKSLPWIAAMSLCAAGAVQDRTEPKVPAPGRTTGPAARSASGTETIESPNGSVRFELFNRGGRLGYEITFQKQAVIEPSPLERTVDGVDLSQGAELGQVRRYELNETYPWLGVHSTATNHCRRAVIAIGKERRRYIFEVRVFDDGAAFRHIIPDEPENAARKGRVPDEATGFIIPPGSTVWHHDLEGHYEGVHRKTAIGEMKPGEWCAPPVVFQSKAGYGAITEADLVNYSGMALQADGEGGFKVGLGHKHPPSYPSRLRDSNDVGRLSEPSQR